MAGWKVAAGGTKLAAAVSLLVEAAAGTYLLTADANLRLAGNSLHWDGLLTFTALNVLLLIAILVRQGRTLWLASGIWSAIGVVAILGDAASGLALSSFSGGANSGWAYLFGFGAVSGSGSAFGTSLAVLLILIFSVSTAAVSLMAARARK